MNMCTGVQIEHKQHRKTLFGVDDSELGTSVVNQFSVCKKLSLSVLENYFYECIFLLLFLVEELIFDKNSTHVHP